MINKLILIIIFGLILFIGGSFLIPPKVIEIIPSPPKISETPGAQTQVWEGGGRVGVQTQSPSDYNPPTTLPQKRAPKSITLILVGDIMLDRGVENMVEKYGQGDFKFPFLKIANELKEVDILFGNLEGPISDKGENVGSIYSFRNNPRAIEGLTFAGFNILSLANNHAFDYGREALEDTFLRLKTAGIDYVGAGFDEKEAYSPAIKEINKTKIGFLAYTNLGPETWKATEGNSGIAWIPENNLEKLKEEIKSAKENSDILIVSLHAGEEYQLEPTQFQVDFAKMAIDAGADLVVGHHPHVIQPVEKYKGGYIAYSLGNFVFDQSFSEETMKGQMIKVLIKSRAERSEARRGSLNFVRQAEGETGEETCFCDHLSPFAALGQMRQNLSDHGKIKEVIPMTIKINRYFQPEINK